MRLRLSRGLAAFRLPAHQINTSHPHTQVSLALMLAAAQLAADDNLLAFLQVFRQLAFRLLAPDIAADPDGLRLVAVSAFDRDGELAQVCASYGLDFAVAAEIAREGE